MGISDLWKRRRTESITLESVEIQWLGLKGKWVADRAQQEASWELYVELITRVSLQPLRGGEGLLREALSSFYSLFGETRKILKGHGPRVARPLGEGTLSFGQIAIEVLNRRLRPVLAKWHPLLQTYESTRPQDVSPKNHEDSWALAEDLRADLESLRHNIVEYADVLAEASGISPLHLKERKRV